MLTISTCGCGRVTLRVSSSSTTHTHTHTHTHTLSAYGLILRKRKPKSTHSILFLSPRARVSGVIWLQTPQDSPGCTVVLGNRRLSLDGCISLEAISLETFRGHSVQFTPRGLTRGVVRQHFGRAEETSWWYQCQEGPLSPGMVPGSQKCRATPAGAEGACSSQTHLCLCSPWGKHKQTYCALQSELSLLTL